MTTTDRAPLDLTEQAIKDLRDGMDLGGRAFLIRRDDARLLLAEIERLRAWKASLDETAIYVPSSRESEPLGFDPDDYPIY